VQESNGSHLQDGFKRALRCDVVHSVLMAACLASLSVSLRFSHSTNWGLRCAYYSRASYNGRLRVMLRIKKEMRLITVVCMVEHLRAINVVCY